MKKLMVCLVIVMLVVPAVADDALSYGTAYTTNGASFNLRASYRVYEREELDVFGLFTLDDFSIHIDGLYTPAIDRWGGGISGRARNTGIQIVDNILDIAHIDGVGFAGILRDTTISLDNVDWCFYAVSDIKF